MNVESRSYLISRHIKEVANRFPNNLALIVDGSFLTYSQLYAMALERAAWFKNNENFTAIFLD